MPIVMPEEKPRELPPPGSHIAICYMVVDLGTQPGGRYKPRRQILVSWELPDEPRSDGQLFAISRRYGYSSDARSSLRQDIESWLGRVLTSDDFGKLDLTELLGCTCQLGVKHEAREDGRMFATISSVMAPGKRTQKRLPLVNTALALSLDDRPFDRATFEQLPEWVRKMIETSPEYKAAVHPVTMDVPGGVQERLRAMLVASDHKDANGKDELARLLDDEIPDFGASEPRADKKPSRRASR
jgi:hypothetical protein